jgi:thioredoxin 2
MAPQFERAARELKGRARLVKVNTEEAPALASRMGIRAIPTIAVFRGGAEVKRVSGALDAGSLVRWAQS